MKANIVKSFKKKISFFIKGSMLKYFIECVPKIESTLEWNIFCSNVFGNCGFRLFEVIREFFPLMEKRFTFVVKNEWDDKKKEIK
jgi:hypothetical protein